MRLSKPVELDRISQALAKGACPICVFLKNEQSALLRGDMPPEKVTSLCNFHAWALAAAVNVENAARIFLNVVRHPAADSPTAAPQCSFCAQLLQQEVVEIKELLTQLKGGLVLDWMKQQGTLCRLHADHVRQLAPLKLHSTIDEIVERSAKTLEAELEALLRRSATGERTGGGMLGRAAEFLTAQRGVNH